MEEEEEAEARDVKMILRAATALFIDVVLTLIVAVIFQDGPWDSTVKSYIPYHRQILTHVT